MRFRRFNDRGMQAFGDYLGRLRENPGLPLPETMLTDPTLTEPLEPGIEAEPTAFEHRMAFARWIHEAARASGSAVPRGDAGFWTWLTAALFDQVCPPDGNGKRKVGEAARYIPEFADARLHYRHLLYGSTMIYGMHRADPGAAWVLLAAPLHRLNHFFYQLASRREIVSNAQVLQVATEMYMHPETYLPTRGAATRGKPGTVFRFVKVLNQLDRNLDLATVPMDSLLEWLPAEFDRFRARRAVATP